MLDSWRNRLRDAEQAFRSGQFEMASRIIRRHDLTRHPQGIELARRIAKGFLGRVAKSRDDAGIARAWLDLHEARLMNVDSARLAKENSRLVDQTLQHVKRSLADGNLAKAKRQLRLFEQFHINDQRAEVYRAALRHSSRADQLAREGRFSEAGKQLDDAVQLAPELKSLRKRRDQMQRHRIQLRELTEKLRKAMTAERWQDVIQLGDELLAFAPKYQIARDARNIANESLDGALKPVDAVSGSNGGRGDGVGRGINRRHVDDIITDENTTDDDGTLNSVDSGISGIAASNSNDSSLTPQGLNGVGSFLMWIDGVGGYLVCLNDQVMIGQALPDGGVDVAIQGDISRRHVRLIRSADQYLLEPLAEVQIDGQLVTEKSILHEGALIEIGRGVKFRFTQPHALSGTARLDLVSRHRTNPWSDGVLLMSDSMVLGPRSQNHVICARWDEDLVVFRRNDMLFCRGPERLEIDGSLVQGEAELTVDSRVVGEDFSLSLERIGRATA